MAGKMIREHLRKKEGDLGKNTKASWVVFSVRVCSELAERKAKGTMEHCVRSLP